MATTSLELFHFALVMSQGYMITPKGGWTGHIRWLIEVPP